MPSEALSPTEKWSSDLKIGDRLRMRRRIRRLSLQQLAEATGLSIGLLSQIERNVSTPSLRSLREICQGLQMPMSWLFETPDEKSSDVVVRADARRRLELSSQGIIKDLITPDTVPEVQMIRITIQPGSTFEGLTSTVPNAAKSGTVLTGTLNFQLAERAFPVTVGDSFAFPAIKPHKLTCTSDQAAVVLWVVTPAIY
ncbi:cupin domain-containing protein [Leptospira interrogans]